LDRISTCIEFYKRIDNEIDGIIGSAHQIPVTESENLLKTVSFPNVPANGIEILSKSIPDSIEFSRYMVDGRVETDA